MAIIGIDLGTSNSAAAVLRGGRPVIIPSAEGVSLGGKAFPSYVALMADGQIVVGEPARRQATVNADGTATALKRKMGHCNMAIDDRLSLLAINASSRPRLRRGFFYWSTIPRGRSAACSENANQTSERWRSQ